MVDMSQYELQEDGIHYRPKRRNNMQQFKKGDRVVYTGARYKRKSEIPVNVGHKGTVINVSWNAQYVTVVWDDEKGARPARQCYAENVALDEPENAIKNALEVLKKHGTVVFTPNPEPWEDELWVCLADHNGWEKGRVRDSTPPDNNAAFWRKIKAREVVE